MASQSPQPQNRHDPEQPSQPHICAICPSPCCTHPQCHTACGAWRCCKCLAENLYNMLWCACDHLGCRECALVDQGCRNSCDPPEEEKREFMTELPVEEEEDGWSSEGWETSDDGGEGGVKRKKEKKEKLVSTCWMFWECCGCGESNAPVREKCRKCARVKCDSCYRRLPRNVAVVGDFM
ncbi:hypothetical protein HOY80DRAFT_979955 [Tuber brumale]|nr:hypothetical protein HOY80DRAFT_979955 [Tuber brumale]